MLYFPLSKMVDSAEAATAPGANITAEGQALVRATGNPSAGVIPSTGTAGDIFAGFAIAGTSAAPFQAPYATKVETAIVPVSGIVSLAQTPVAGQLFVYDNTTNAAVASPTVAGATVTSLTAGDTVTVTYKYALTVVQSRALQGDVQAGGAAGYMVGQIGLLKRGLIYTTEFDNSKNWSAATAIKLAASGQITDQSGSGVAIQGYVVQVPNGDVPFLGIEFSAA